MDNAVSKAEAMLNDKAQEKNRYNRGRNNKECLKEYFPFQFSIIISTISSVTFQFYIRLPIPF